jgi:hypothetical protein
MFDGLVKRLKSTDTGIFLLLNAADIAKNYRNWWPYFIFVAFAIIQPFYPGLYNLSKSFLFWIIFLCTIARPSTTRKGLKYFVSLLPRAICFVFCIAFLELLIVGKSSLVLSWPLTALYISNPFLPLFLLFMYDRVPIKSLVPNLLKLLYAQIKLIAVLWTLMIVILWIAGYAVELSPWQFVEFKNWSFVRGTSLQELIYFMFLPAIVTTWTNVYVKEVYGHVASYTARS